MAEILQFLTSFCHGNMRKPLLRWIKIGHSTLNSVKLWTIWIEILGSGDLERQFEMGWNVSKDLALSQPGIRRCSKCSLASPLEFTALRKEDLLHTVGVWGSVANSSPGLCTALRIGLQPMNDSKTMS
jgi:hypothetical protein